MHVLYLCVEIVDHFAAHVQPTLDLRRLRHAIILQLHCQDFHVRHALALPIGPLRHFDGDLLQHAP